MCQRLLGSVGIAPLACMLAFSGCQKPAPPSKTPDQTAAAPSAKSSPMSGDQSVSSQTSRDTRPQQKDSRPPMAPVPESLPVPEQAKVDTVLDNERMQYVMAVVQADSSEVILNFNREQLPKKGWTVGVVKPLLTGDPMLPFENDQRSGDVRVGKRDDGKGFSVHIETKPKQSNQEQR